MQTGHRRAHAPIVSRRADSYPTPTTTRTPTAPTASTPPGPDGTATAAPGTSSAQRATCSSHHSSGPVNRINAPAPGAHTGHRAAAAVPSTVIGGITTATARFASTPIRLSCPEMAAISGAVTTWAASAMHTASASALGQPRATRRADQIGASTTSAAVADNPALSAVVPDAQRLPRAAIKQLADGYFSTLQYNTGEIRGARFAPGAVRHENGMPWTDIEQGFKTGHYRYNNRVRDRDCFLVDEARGFTMCRGFIDHKGVLDEYTMTDGTTARSNYQEPQTWGFLESFKVTKGGIVAVEATFSAVPYYLRSPWTKHPDPTYDASKPAATRAFAPAPGPASR